MFVSLFSRGDCGCLATGLSLFGRGGLCLYSLGGGCWLREEFGTPLLYKSSSVEVPSVGVLGGQDSGLEILHGGEGGDVELRARTSEHILVFAFDPLSL